MKKCSKWFKVDKLDVEKLETAPVDLSKLSNIAKTNVIKKTEYDELVKKLVLFRLLIR